MIYPTLWLALRIFVFNHQQNHYILLDILGAFCISKHPFRSWVGPKKLRATETTHDRKSKKSFAASTTEHFPSWNLNVNYSSTLYQENCRTEWTPHHDTEFVLSTSSTPLWHGLFSLLSLQKLDWMIAATTILSLLLVVPDPNRPGNSVYISIQSNWFIRV